MTIRNNIAQRFDRAADRYDHAASVQADIAKHLVQMAVQKMPYAPAAILDIGSGTGFAAAGAAQHWPHASVTALDAAPDMLKQAQRKIPHLRVIEGNITERTFAPQFDLIVSSMALHWLPEPRVMLEQWRQWLKPNGRLFAACLVEGSFRQWRDLCATEKLADGLWTFPPAAFADNLITEQQAITVDYLSAKDFLDRLKATGAAMPRPDYRPFAIPAMRRLLSLAPRPFSVTYEVIYIEMQSLGSI